MCVCVWGGFFCVFSFFMYMGEAFRLVKTSHKDFQETGHGQTPCNGEPGLCDGLWPSSRPSLPGRNERPNRLPASFFPYSAPMVLWSDQFGHPRGSKLRSKQMAPNLRGRGYRRGRVGGGGVP